MRRCAAASVVAAYIKSTPHAFGLARLASGIFTKSLKGKKDVGNGFQPFLCAVKDEPM